MWRFVVICLAVMAFAFYELSGGADYEPAPNSLQAQANLPKEERIAARPQQTEPEDIPDVNTAAVSRTEELVEEAIEELETREVETREVSVTLPTTRTDAIGLLEELEENTRFDTRIITDAQPLEPAQEAEPETRTTTSAIDAAIAAVLGEPEPSPDDRAVSAALGDVVYDESQLRLVSEPIIDVRTGPGLTFDRVTRIREGTEVVVLEDPGFGWLNVHILNRYQSGWVAEWLLRKPE